MKLAVALGGFLVIAQAESVVTIPLSNAIDYARMIAHDQGYDVSNTMRYTFDSVNPSKVRPFKRGYTGIGFDVAGHSTNLILINNSTGQAIDFNTCEVFDYPDLRTFQDQIMRTTKVKRKTPSELATSIGCSPPRLLTQPIPVVR